MNQTEASVLTQERYGLGVPHKLSESGFFSISGHSGACVPLEQVGQCRYISRNGTSNLTLLPSHLDLLSDQISGSEQSGQSVGKYLDDGQSIPFSCFANRLLFNDGELIIFGENCYVMKSSTWRIVYDNSGIPYFYTKGQWPSKYPSSQLERWRRVVKTIAVK